MFRLQWEQAETDVIHVPGGKPAAILLASVGFTTTLFAIGLSLLPPPEEPNKALAMIKVIGLTAVLVGVGAVLYYFGKSKAKRQPIVI